MADNAITYFNDDGKSIPVTLDYTTPGGSFVYIDGWFGITGADGESDDPVALNVDERSYQLHLPDSVNPAVGDILYVTVASVTGAHAIPDAAWSTSAGSGKIAVAKVIQTRFGSTGEYFVKVKMLPQSPVGA